MSNFFKKSNMKGLAIGALLATAASVGSVAASTVTINFESGYTDNQLLNDPVKLLDAAGNETFVTLDTANDNTMSIEASGAAGADEFDGDFSPDSFVVAGPTANDSEFGTFDPDLGNFFLRNTSALSFNAGAVNPVFSLLFDGNGAAEVSAQIWDIDGNTTQGTEKWTLTAFNSGGGELATIISPEGTSTGNGTLDGAPWLFTFTDIGAIARIDFDFTGTKTTGIGVAFDNLTVMPVPLPAGGLLLLSALGGVAVLRRRRKAA